MQACKLRILTHSFLAFLEKKDQCSKIIKGNNIWEYASLI